MSDPMVLTAGYWDFWILNGFINLVYLEQIVHKLNWIF